MDVCENRKTPLNSYEDFLMKKYLEKNRPLTIHFELTQKCNLRCIHCLFNHTCKDELSTNEIFQILIQLENYGVFDLALSGGEMFMRNDIAEILEFLRLHRFTTTLYTNGTLLNYSLIDKIALIKPSSVEISVYGATADVHESITRVTGSFQKTINSINQLVNAGVQVTFKGFLLKNNFHQRLHMIELANQIGVPYEIDFNVIPMVNGDISNLSVSLNIEQLKQIYHEVTSEGLIMRNTIRIKGKDSQLPKGGNVICNPGRITGCIASNGDVFPCAVLRIKMGNLKENKFKEIWATQKINTIRYMELNDLKICSVCPTLEYCNRCPGVAYLETGDYLGPAPSAVCSKYKSLVEETKEVM